MYTVTIYEQPNTITRLFKTADAEIGRLFIVRHDLTELEKNALSIAFRQFNNRLKPHETPTRWLWDYIGGLFVQAKGRGEIGILVIECINKLIISSHKRHKKIIVK